MLRLSLTLSLSRNRSRGILTAHFSHPVSLSQTSHPSLFLAQPARTPCFPHFSTGRDLPICATLKELYLSIPSHTPFVLVMYSRQRSCRCCSWDNSFGTFTFRYSPQYMKHSLALILTKSAVIWIIFEV